MGPPRGRRPGFWSNRRHYAYAPCTEEEYALIQRFAEREGLTVANFTRRCINQWLLEEGDNVPLLEEKGRAARTA